MDPDKPYITKRPHKKVPDSSSLRPLLHLANGEKQSRNGCTQCKQRKQKCDEAKPACGSCKKRKALCQYTPKPTTKAPKKPLGSIAVIEEVQGKERQLAIVKSPSSSYSSESEISSHKEQRSPSTAGSVTSVEEIPRSEPEAWNKGLFVSAGIPRSLKPVPWRNAFEHSLWNSYYATHLESLAKPGIDDATKQIWLHLVPQISLSTDRTLFKLLLSLGSMHVAMKTLDYPDIKPGSEGARLWNLSDRYFSNAISSFRDIITSKKIYETNPEVFCVIALVLSFRSGMNANHHHTDAYSLYDDMLSWFSAALGYIALGGFYTKRLQNTQLGDIMRANPGATYHFYPFLEYIKTQSFPQFDYLHPISDPVTGNLDPEDSTDKALNAYTMSLKLIGWVYQAAIDGASVADIYGMFQTVPYTVPSHFLELLRQRRPRAMAVLAHHIALSAFLGVYERLHFWPREHILLLQTLVPVNWSWAFQKAVDIVNRAENLQPRVRSMVLSAKRQASSSLDTVE